MGTGAGCTAALLGGPPEVPNTDAGTVLEPAAGAGAEAGAEVGAAKLRLLWVVPAADEAFWRAMLASLSKMLGIAELGGSAVVAVGNGTGAAVAAARGLLPAPNEASSSAGGLPGGVVDSSAGRDAVRAHTGVKRH